MAILCRYTYDPLDRLSTVTPLAQAVANRFYNGEHLMTELHGGRQRTCVRAGAQLLAQQSREGAEVVTMMIASDLHNSVLHASEDGHQADIAYSPYGHHDSTQTLDGMPGFNGEQSDPLTGYYLLGNGYRAYNPVLMRFNSPDSLSPFGKGGVNAYAYCAGDPVNRVDPTGHESAWFWVGLGLSVLGTQAGVRGMVLSKGAKELAGSVAAILTGVVALAPATGSALTKNSNPEISSILQYVGFGFGLSSSVVGQRVTAMRLKRQKRLIQARARQNDAKRAAQAFNPDNDLPHPYELPPSYDEAYPDPLSRDIARTRAFDTSGSSIRSTDSSDIPLQNVGSNAQAVGAGIRAPT
ncbi:RHS repeat-associated core domain-containing protein [Pseudomonas syringae]|uniref:RHS repeat-associated core domain-containing protein n=1 Tax=Pseudomonas syringae TaxID=317 RepID=UPI001917150B|nr:RHS repeat-associated core domain-containing protein [Pseudomonas syringae]QQQ50928.1 RHS repeat-associated core domain-containing protein [Pseudomonas syringae]